jgi:metal-responsive CopG/Arc/MetJ family transcriptional regulator
MKKKKKVTVTINKEVMEKVDKLTTSRSRLVEHILLEYLTRNGIKTDDIIL